MGQHRKNKAPWVGDKSPRQDWFKANLKRQRRRNKLAHLSRRKNRK